MVGVNYYHSSKTCNIQNQYSNFQKNQKNNLHATLTSRLVFNFSAKIFYPYYLMTGNPEFLGKNFIQLVATFVRSGSRTAQIGIF
jgi:hypothetical protein